MGKENFPFNWNIYRERKIQIIQLKQAKISFLSLVWFVVLVFGYLDAFDSNHNNILVLQLLSAEVNITHLTLEKHL